MKPEELMLGDWIQIVPDAPILPNECHRVYWIRTGEIGLDNRSIVTHPYIQPIPLTSEILEKNGFTYCKSDGGFYLHATISYGNWDVDVVLFDVTDEYRNNQLHISSPDDSYIAIHLMECNHVHELQHALRLCGIEKEIVL